jgi:hypothetical protein
MLCQQRNAQLTGYTPMPAGLLSGPVKTAGLHSGVLVSLVVSFV